MMTETELRYAVALTLIPGISKATLCEMFRQAGSAVEAYNRFKTVQPGEEFTERLAGQVQLMPQYLDRAGQEIAFAESRGIRILTLADVDYPARLRDCPDAPAVLYYKGNANLNVRHVIAMVGTRHCTEYGRDICRTFLRDLKALCPDVLVISGLAYGIDVHAHQEALNNGLPTIGVLAHGLDMLYPASHKRIANEMVANGGLLTEFMSGSNSDRYHFVQRNRIVAGMSDATIVVESKDQGGSLITAELAEMYYRDVFACPGRVTDMASKGCNELIQSNRASLLLDARHFVESMGWETASAPGAIQRELFVELTPLEEKVVQALSDYEPHGINTLVVQCNVPVQQMLEILCGLEMKGIVKAMVGSQYRLLS